MDLKTECGPGRAPIMCGRATKRAAYSGELEMSPTPVPAGATEHRVRIDAGRAALVIALCLIVSIVASVLVASSAYKKRSERAWDASRTITVKGSSRQRVRSDLAVWRISVKGEGKKLEDAYAAVEDAAARLRDFLDASGFKNARVELSPIETEVHHARDGRGDQTREVEAYELSRSFTVTTSDVDGVATAAGKVTDLIKQGVLVFGSPPQYTYTKLPDMRIAILGEASRDARTRAEEIAKNAGSRVSEVRSAQTSPLQVVQPDSTETSGYGSYDTVTIEKDVYAVVTLTLGVEPQ